MADKIMRMPAPSSPAPLSPIQAPSIMGQHLGSSGQPLDASTRAHLEPRFGHDFSNVRVFSDAQANASARSVSAQAYTVGRDIVFAEGRYAPASSEGQALLSHELSHVVQQGQGVQLQRKIDVLDAGVDLTSYFGSQGVTGTNRLLNEYSHPGASGTTTEMEVLYSMLVSPRIFTVDGSTTADAETSLDSHVQSRKGIVDFAAQKKYAFGAGTSMRMNPAYWEQVGSGWRVKSGVSREDAMKDVNVNPAEYAIACQAATTITMQAGSGFSPMARDTGVADTDWVPGDWGYIKNNAFTGLPADVGLEGENLIYVGFQSFWGHFTGANTYRGLNEWFAEVQGWNGSASILSHRDRPSRGLV